MGKVNLKTIAEKLKLDVSTVSRALRDDERVKPSTKDKVKDLAERLNYTPDLAAKSLVTGRSEIIGIILPEIKHLFYSEIFEEFSKISLENGLVAELFLTEFSPFNLQRIIPLIYAQKLRGVVIGYHQVNFPALKERLKNDFAIVLIDQAEGDNFDTVMVDNEKGMREGLSYLIGLGHRKIGFISDRVTGPVRFKVYCEVLKESDIEIDENFIDIKSGRCEEVGYQAGLKVLSLKSRPTAIFCANDLIATGLMKAAFETGIRIPADLSILGFDDLPLSGYLPVPLSTIRQPIAEIVQQSFYLLLQKIKEPSKKFKNIVLPSELIVRKSTAEPNKK